MDAQVTGEGCALSTTDDDIAGGFLRFFRELPDPRAANSLHSLSDIFAIAICAVICGAEGWVQVQMFGQSKQALASLAVVEAEREVNGKRSCQRRYFISSLSGTDAKAMAGYIRGHWGIENRLHWQLDVSFNEDQRRIRKDHAAENSPRLCRMALNLLKSDKTLKVGVKSKRLRAGWDEPYMLRLLTR